MSDFIGCARIARVFNMVSWLSESNSMHGLYARENEELSVMYQLERQTNGHALM